MTYDQRKETRNCPAPPYGCGQEKALHHFSYLPFDTRCWACCPAQLGEEIAGRKIDLVRKQANDIFGEVDKGAGVPRIDELLGEVYRRFGGFTTFAQSFVDDLKKAQQLRPGSIGVLQVEMALMKLTAQSTKLLDDKEMDQMTIEEMKAARNQALMQMIAEAAEDPRKVEVIKKLLDARNMVASDENAQEVLHG